jgi:hypothetical protein
MVHLVKSGSGSQHLRDPSLWYSDSDSLLSDIVNAFINQDAQFCQKHQIPTLAPMGASSPNRLIGRCCWAQVIRKYIILKYIYILVKYTKLFLVPKCVTDAVIIIMICWFVRQSVQIDALLNYNWRVNVQTLPAGLGFWGQFHRNWSCMMQWQIQRGMRECTPSPVHIRLVIVS